MKTRFNEHNDVTKPTTMMNHIKFDDLEIIDRGKRDKELLVKETLHVIKLKPVMNKNVTSYPPELFQ